MFHSFHGLINSINWPASSIWVFIAQLGEHCSANAEVTGSNPVEAPKNFFSGYFRNCLNCHSLRWSHTHFICIPAVHINAKMNTYYFRRHKTAILGPIKAQLPFSEGKYQLVISWNKITFPTIFDHLNIFMLQHSNERNGVSSHKYPFKGP